MLLLPRCDAPFFGKPAVNPGEQLRIEHTGRFGFLSGLMPGEAGQDLVMRAFGRALSEDRPQCVDYPGFPIDQGAVAIEGEDFEIAEAHRWTSSIAAVLG